MGVLVTVRGPGARADWPTWRCGAPRSGATAEDLPRELALRWRRQLPPPMVAWPLEPRSQFDACDEPVVVGARIFVPSSRHGSLTAFDTESGRRLWQFFTDGPVRFAPAVAGGQAFVASDDGYLYCLNAADGTLRWRFRGGPDSRRHLGNEQLVSLWPARGGPVVVGDTVYFAAGIWPVTGIFVHAIDARTGKALWTNRSANDLEDLQTDHDFRSTGGISPQGYLVATAEYLVVPNGRSMPAYLARADGKLLHYVQGYHQGTCRIAANDDLLMIGNFFYPLRRMVRGDNDRFFLVCQNPVGPPPVDAYAFSSEFLFGIQGRTVVCYPVDKIASPTVHEIKHAAQPWWKPEYKYAGGFSYQAYEVDKAWSFNFPRETWRRPAPAAPRAPQPPQLIRAGSRLYAVVAQTLIAVDLSEHSRSPSVAWTKPLATPACSLLAAAGKLFVVTSDATLLCFGGTAGAPRELAEPSAPLPQAGGPPAQAAAEIVRHSRVTEGYGLVLGIDSGELTMALLQHTKLRLIVIEEEPRRAQRLRDRLIESGCYGSRAQVVVDDPRTIVLPPYLASLIVSERFTVAGILGDPARSRPVLQALRPFGGVACLPLGHAGAGGWRQCVAAAGLDLADAEVAGDWGIVRRPRGPVGSADWSHPCGDAANSLFSRDTAVKPPLAVLWYGDSPTCGFRGPNHTPENAPPVVTHGVLAGIDPRSVSAIDVYTGRPLWQRPLAAEDGKPAPARIAADGRVYVACGSRLEILDAVSGSLRRSAVDGGEAIKGGRPIVRDLFVADGVALSLYAFPETGTKGAGDSKLLVAWDCRSGSVLWRRPAQFGYSTSSLGTRSMLACGDGRVFLVDTLAPKTRWDMRRRGEKADAPCTLMALALRTGETLWKESLPPHSGEYLAYCPESGVLLHQLQFFKLRALEGATGKLLWEKPFRVCYTPLMVGPSSFYAIEWTRQIHIAGYSVACNCYDVRSGALLRASVFRSEQFACNYTHASPFLLTRRDQNTYACWIDAASGDVCRMGNVRSGCTQSLIPAAGLVNAPNLNCGCGCNYPVQSSYALVPCRAWAGWSSIPGKESASTGQSPTAR